jgi:hypothetical protein
MNFQSQLRNRQDRLRNAGWRIQWPLPPSSKCINIWTKESALMDPAYYGLILITHFKLFFTKKDGGCKLSWLGCILVSMIANL